MHFTFVGDAAYSVQQMCLQGRIRIIRPACVCISRFSSLKRRLSLINEECFRKLYSAILRLKVLIIGPAGDNPRGLVNVVLIVTHVSTSQNFHTSIDKQVLNSFQKVLLIDTHV